MTEGQARLEEARARVARVFQDAQTPPVEIVESLEMIIQDCEMYQESVARRMEEESEEIEGDPDGP